MLFPTDSVSSNLLLYEIARHNFRSFVVKDFELEPMNFGRLGMIVVRGFANMNELDHYRRVMAASPDFRIPAGVRPVAISAANFDALQRAGLSFDDYFRYLDEQNYVDAQAGLLRPEEVETLQEADEAADVSPDEDEDTIVMETEAPADVPSAAPAVEAVQPPLPEKTPVRPAVPLPAGGDGGSEGDDPLFE